MQNRTTNRMKDRRGGLSVHVTVTGTTVTVRVSGIASSVDFDDSEAIDEFSLVEEVIARAARQRMNVMHLELAARLDAGCSARLVDALKKATRQGVAFRLSSVIDAPFRDPDGSTVAVLSLPASVRRWEPMVHHVGILLSAVVGWIQYLWHKIQ